MAKRTPKNIQQQTGPVIPEVPNEFGGGPPPVDTPSVQATVTKPATKMVNVSGESKSYGGMTDGVVKPRASCPVPKDPNHVQYLLNHGFELR